MSRNNTIIFAGLFSAFTLTVSSATFHFLHESFDQQDTQNVLKNIQMADNEAKTETETNKSHVTPQDRSRPVLRDDGMPLIKANVPDAGAQAELPKMQHDINVRNETPDAQSDYLNSLATSGFNKTPNIVLKPEQDGQRPNLEKSHIEKAQSGQHPIAKPETKTEAKPITKKIETKKEVTGAIQDPVRTKKKSARSTDELQKKDQESTSSASQNSVSEPISSLKTFDFAPY